MKNNTIQRGGAIALAETLFTSLGKILCLLLILSAFALTLTPSARADNAVSTINGSTNTFNFGGNTMQVGVVLAATTNYYNLSTVNGSFSNTNNCPAVTLQKQYNQFNQSRLVNFQQQFQYTAANAGQDIVRIAASTDGTKWLTNPCPIIAVSTANGTAIVQWSTNNDTGGLQYFCVYSIENTNAAAARTNGWLGTGFNRGL